jgi:hypothetical protein
MTGKLSPPPKKPNPTPIPSPNQSPIEISDLLDNLPVNACVELTRRLLTAVPTLPSGAARSRAECNSRVRRGLPQRVYLVLLPGVVVESGDAAAACVPRSPFPVLLREAERLMHVGSLPHT